MTVQELLEISKDGFGSFKIYDKKNHEVIYDSLQIMEDLSQLTQIQTFLIKSYDWIEIRDKMGYTIKQIKDVLMKLQKYERVTILYKE